MHDSNTKRCRENKTKNGNKTFNVPRNDYLVFYLMIVISEGKTTISTTHSEPHLVVVYRGGTGGLLVEGWICGGSSVCSKVMKVRLK